MVHIKEATKSSRQRQLNPRFANLKKSRQNNCVCYLLILSQRSKEPEDEDLLGWQRQRVNGEVAYHLLFHFCPRTVRALCAIRSHLVWSCHRRTFWMDSRFRTLPSTRGKGMMSGVYDFFNWRLDDTPPNRLVEQIVGRWVIGAVLFLQGRCSSIVCFYCTEFTKRPLETISLQSEFHFSFFFEPSQPIEQKRNQLGIPLPKLRKKEQKKIIIKFAQPCKRKWPLKISLAAFKIVCTLFLKLCFSRLVAGGKI